MGSKIRVGVIGLGMGSNHARDYKASPNAELVAICDIDPARLKARAAEFAPVHAYADYKEMIRKERLDAVSVAVPNFLHCPLTCYALNHGLNVLCEKPMAMNAREAMKMRDLAKRKRLKLMIHFNYRWTQEAQALKRIVDEGILGKVYWGHTRWLRTRGFPGNGTWFTVKSRSGGGPLIDLGVHRTDLALWLMGYPEVSSVTAATYNHLARNWPIKALIVPVGATAGGKIVVKKGADVEDLASAFIRFKNGSTLTLEASWDLNGERFEDQLTEIYGTKGGIVHRNVGEGYVYEARAYKEIGGRMATIVPKIYGGGSSAVGHFVDCVANNKAPEASADNGVYVMKILDAIYESAKLGREVKVK